MLFATHCICICIREAHARQIIRLIRCRARQHKTLRPGMNIIQTTHTHTQKIERRNDNDLSGTRTARDTHAHTFQCARNCILRQNATLRKAAVLYPLEMKTHARTHPFICWKHCVPTTTSTTKTSTVTHTHTLTRARSMNLDSAAPVLAAACNLKQYFCIRLSKHERRAHTKADRRGLELPSCRIWMGFRSISKRRYNIDAHMALGCARV